MSFPVPEATRMEIKFVSHHVNLHRVLTWLRVHDAGFHSPYPPRRINSVYFDTQDSQAYTANVSGSSARTKVRYRWYGESPLPGPGYLEVKRKRNFFGWKLRYELDQAPYRDGATWQAIRRQMMTQLPPEGRQWLALWTLPTLMNRYHRRYFLSSDGLVRVTVDTGQRAWDQRFKSIPDFLRHVQLSDSVVVEFKFDRRDRQVASDVMQGIPIRVSPHSKYIRGLGASL